jgi:hypothetical protein
LQVDEIQSLKNQIIDHLQNNLHTYIPPQHKLLYQGNVTSETIKISELQPEDDDHFFFLYDLDAKQPQPQPQLPPPPPPVSQQVGSTQNLIDSLVSSWSQVQNNNLYSPPPVHNANTAQETQRATMLKIIQSDDFFPDQESLALLVSMGFSKSRSKKALVISYFELQAATEWLIAHSFDPDIDDPLTADQINEILNRVDAPISTPPPPVVQQPPQSIEVQLQNAIKNRTCTFMVTKNKFTNQNWYHCFTCGLVDAEGVCESCMHVCHEGHVISEVKTGLFICDCGNNKSAHNCQCCK